jgi:hypothetical protein
MANYIRIPRIHSARNKAGIAGAFYGGLTIFTATAAFALSAFLPPGASIPVPPTTAATEPDLGGVVLRDTLLPFTIKAPTGATLCAGQLQDRVVRSNKTGLLHFYYRIRDTKGPGMLARMSTSSFPVPALRVAYRTDGLGTVAPRMAARSAVPGTLVTFGFVTSPTVPPFSCAQHEESRFILIKTTTKTFHPGGITRIYTTTGANAVVPTVMP